MGSLEQGAEVQDSVNQKTATPYEKPDTPEVTSEDFQKKIGSVLSSMEDASGLKAEGLDEAGELPNRAEVIKMLEKIPATEFLKRSEGDLQRLFLRNGKVDFYENLEARASIGMGDMYPQSQAYIKCDGVVGKRSVSPSGKVGYLGAGGEYLAITGGEIIDVVYSEDEVVAYEASIKENNITIPVVGDEVALKTKFIEKIGKDEALTKKYKGIEKNIQSEAVIKGLIADYFPKADREKAFIVMMGEGGLDANNFRPVYENPGGGCDMGHFQINTKWQADLLKEKNITPGDLLDPRTNIKFAATLFGREGWKPFIAARKMGIA